MWSAAAVLVCALDVLGRSLATLPPITLIDVPPRGASEGVEAFVRAGENRIYLVTSSAVYRHAQAARQRCGNRDSVRKIASIIVHEEWHVRHGSDEREAYHAQLVALLAMGADAGSPLYAAVSRSMRAVTVSPRAPLVAAALPEPLAARTAVLRR